LKPGEAFYYVDEFNVSWQPTLKAMWSPKGQQIKEYSRAFRTPKGMKMGRLLSRTLQGRMFIWHCESEKE
jgi:hypothetical protein